MSACIAKFSVRLCGQNNHLLRRAYGWQWNRGNILSRSLGVQSQEKCCTVQEVRLKLLKHMGLEHQGYQRFKYSRDHLLELLPKSKKELPPRTMQDSFDSAIIPLGKDLALQERYVSFLGHVRTGRLMEDLDIFAVWLTHKHLKLPKELAADQPTPYVIVTVLVDQIDFTDLTPTADQDIRLSGHVSWVGSSSLETIVWMDQHSPSTDTWNRMTTATFLMAARDSNNEGPALVNPLVAETDEEKAILEQGEKKKQRRLKLQSTSLYRTLPSVSEQRAIHDIFLKTLETPGGGRSGIPTFKSSSEIPNSVTMSSATMSSIVFCHPEDRNMHNKVFGGFLMRQALELGWTAGYMYSKYRPKLCHISNIGFHAPVDVGSLLGLSAYVCYTEQNYMQISVYAEVFDPRSGTNVTTNDFHYTFSIPEELPAIIPKSYQECMMYLDGRRRFQHVMGLKKD
ncbi:acyl-coenzyme A thioesterase 9, mitochondrial-like [Ischnura elegans]|uniref:acyl-coenzyme A thioesterase 9, mitochondrial-like n=1 Tax=Ischnura elegans TaxID=197161 RepID=UPI001ED8BF70|nr:acyl-coenzyme A thioesterase 9, mitochondrial-like [Ischnura elegans]XP_046392967.1 acyl-coenzyme A thioesterase 9, mitochondrial-like [Ischnura elegans]